jgi:hypothetical protein
MLTRDERPTINFMDAYRKHYGGQEDVVMQRLETLPGSRSTVRLILACRRPDFAGFRYSENGQPFYPSLDNTFLIRLGGESKKWEGKAQPVYRTGPGPVTYAITATYKSQEEYRAEGIEHPSIINVQIAPPLDFEVRAPESWAVPAPTDEERQFAEATWGRHASGAATDYDKAKALAKAICHDLWPHNGAPIPEMQWYSPFEMYRAMMSGKSKGFCTHFGMTFVHACKCFGVMARNAHIERPVEYGAAHWLFLQGMHCTSEIFSRELNRWIFMDLRFYCLGAYLGEEGPLTLGELHLFMCQPHWRRRLRFHIYDMQTREEKRLPMEECPRPDIHFYTGWHTAIHIGYE